MSETLYNTLLSKLNKFIRKYYKNQLVKGAIYAFIGLLGYFLITATLEYFGQFNSAIRGVFFYGFILFAGYILYRYIAVPLLKLNKIGNFLTHEQAADIIGKHFSNVQDKLLNVLQLRELAVALPQDLLLQAGVEQKIKQLSPIPFAGAIDFGENKKYLKYLLPVLLIGLFLLIFIPGVYTDAPMKIINHSTYFAPVAPFSFEVKNKKLSVLKGDDYDLLLEISGTEIPQQVYIQYGGKQFLMEKSGKLSFHYTFKNVQQSIQFQFSANGFSSSVYSLKALPKPILLDFSVKLNYPKYIGKKDETLHNNGDLIVPEGTYITWTFNTRDADKLQFLIGDSAFAVNQNNSNQYNFHLRAMRSFNYGLKPSNNIVKNMDTIHYQATVIPDLYPTINLQSRADSITNKLIYFNGFIKDDYGLTKLTFNYKKLNSDTTAAQSKGKWITVNIPINKDMLQQQYYYTWNLDTLHLQPGQSINYFFQVWDNDGVNGHKSSKTSIAQFAVPKYKVLAEQSDQKGKGIENRINKAIEQAMQLKSGLDQLNENLFNKTQLGWSEKQKISDLVKLHDAMLENIKHIERENTRKNSLDKSYLNLDSNLIKKQAELQKMLQKLMTPELKKLFDKLQKMMNQLNKSQLQNQIDSMKLSNKDISKALDRSLELFKQLEFQKKLDQLSDKLKTVAQKQDSLAQKSNSRKADSKELEKAQKKLNDMFNQVKDDINALKKQNEQLENKHDMGDLQKNAQAASQQQQQATSQLQQGKNKSASKSQSSAAQKMQQMMNKVSSMQSQMNSGASPEDLQNLRNILENLVQLSFDQENLMEKTKNTSINDPQYVKLAQQQMNLSEDSKGIEDSLFALSKRVIQIKSTVNQEIDKINMNMKKAISYMTDRKTDFAISRQQFVMTSTNNLALLLDDVVQQMMNAMKSGKPGQGSCNKPGGNGKPSSMPSMQSLKQMLESQLKQMQKAMQQGGNKPGSKPGSLPSNQGMSEQLAKMAAKQAYIRQQLDQLSQQMRGSGGGKGLDGINKLLDENKKDIVNNNITPETLKRQHKIITRLLQAANAQRTRGFEKKREAIQAKKQFFGNKNEYFEYNKEKQSEVELLKTMPPDFTNYYKNKVADYFQNITK